MNSIAIYFKYSGCLSLQTAIDEVFGLLRESINRFELLASELLGQNYNHPGGVKAKEQAGIIIDAFRNIFVGNYNWLVETADEA